MTKSEILSAEKLVSILIREAERTNYQVIRVEQDVLLKETGRHQLDHTFVSDVFFQMRIRDWECVWRNHTKDGRTSGVMYYSRHLEYAVKASILEDWGDNDLIKQQEQKYGDGLLADPTKLPRTIPHPPRNPTLNTVDTVLLCKKHLITTPLLIKE